jgi:DNA-binding PadR family transcriptional regulator
MTLTTTSYAILGHLAMQPWTMYDLAAQMRRNVHYFFPRAESQVYAEPKRLVELGLATAVSEATGKRTRTVYAITDAGRAELKRWLASSLSKGPVLEFEALLRVVLAPFGDKEDLAAALTQTREEIGAIFVLGERICDEYTSGTAPLQRYMLARSMLHDFLWSFGELVDDWAARSLKRMEDWEKQTPVERTAAAVEVYRVRTRRKRSKLPTPPPHDFHGRPEE